MSDAATTTSHASARFMIGARAECADGPCGTITRVVVDPVARVVTHLVVQPRHHRGPGRLVPLGMLDPGLLVPGSGSIQLHCTAAELLGLDAAEETHFLPPGTPYADYARGQALVWPYYGLGSGGSFVSRRGPRTGPLSQTVTRDVLPVGEVAVRRGDRVHATDGEIGRVRGLVVTESDHGVTHVLLEEGHVLGRREVAIPIGAVTSVDHGVVVSLTKRQIEDLPAVDLVPSTP